MRCSLKLGVDLQAHHAVTLFEVMNLNENSWYPIKIFSINLTIRNF